MIDFDSKNDHVIGLILELCRAYLFVESLVYACDDHHLLQINEWHEMAIDLQETLTETEK